MAIHCRAVGRVDAEHIVREVMEAGSKKAWRAKEMLDV